MAFGISFVVGPPGRLVYLACRIRPIVAIPANIRAAAVWPAMVTTDAALQAVGRKNGADAIEQASDAHAISSSSVLDA